MCERRYPARQRLRPDGISGKLDAARGAPYNAPEFGPRNLASQHHLHPAQTGQWQKAAIEQMAELFVDGGKCKPRDGEVEKEALCEEIGRLKWSWTGSKKLACSIEDRRPLVKLAHLDLSIRRQCELLDVDGRISLGLIRTDPPAGRSD